MTTEVVIRKGICPSSVDVTGQLDDDDLNPFIQITDETKTNTVYTLETRQSAKIIIGRQGLYVEIVDTGSDTIVRIPKMKNEKIITDRECRPFYSTLGISGISLWQKLFGDGKPHPVSPNNANKDRDWLGHMGIETIRYTGR